MKTFLDVVQALAGLATTAAVFFTAVQIRAAKRQSIVAFEDQMSAQYREIIRRLPIEALLGESLGENAERALADFYYYFDLSNEQAYLHEKGRITSETWQEWKEGMLQNFARPAFARAWQDVTRRAPQSFDELKRVLAEMKTRS